MSLIFKKPGLLTTVQDLGRTGGRSFGINPNGLMDTAAARIVNVLLGNHGSEAVVEMHFPAPEIEFDEDAAVAIGGADLDARLNDRSVSNWSAFHVSKGSILRFGKRRSGNRTCLAVRGGFRIDKWLGSASTNLVAATGGVSGRKLRSGDRIDCREMCKEFPARTVGPSIIPLYSRFPTVRVVAGCEFDLLSPTGKRIFLGDGFTLTNNCDRMGYRLTGKPLHLLHEIQMVSAAVTFGTVQLLPDGEVIVLMADHQTSGGYPRIGNVISVDLPILAQCGPGDGVSFAMVSVEEAELLELKFERELKFLRVGCRLQIRNAVG